MHSPLQARSRFSFKASHRRMTLKISHATSGADEPPTRAPSASQKRAVSAPVARERYIAPPRRGRR
jgi:hypothetical protein